jgi:hypothetical protein
MLRSLPRSARVLRPADGQKGIVLSVEVQGLRRLRFGDGAPVRAASAVAPFGDGWLVAQDDATAAAWVRGHLVTRVRLLDPVEGHAVFSSAEGTKHLKPDLEAACDVGRGRVLLLGSGSTPARMRCVLMSPGGAPSVGHLPVLYEQVADALGRPLDQLNLEGACVVGEQLRWFARGNAAAGVPSASVDVELASLLALVASDGGAPRLGAIRSYDLGAAAGVQLAVTDAVALPDGRVLVSAAAEDTPNAVDDGPVVGSSLVLLDGARVVGSAALPRLEGAVAKVEGLALVDADPGGARVLAVVDDDAPERPSAELVLSVRW